jgi:hypothetical protein
MAMSVYVALSADALSSCVPTVDAPRDGRKSCVGDLNIRELCSQLISTKKTRQWKPALKGALQKRSKKVKVDVERALEIPAPAVVHFPLLTLIGPSGRLCFHFLCQRVSLTLLNI